MPFIEYDPSTNQPVATQPVQKPQPQRVQNQQQPPAFDLEKYAADSADRQMAFAVQRGQHPTRGDWEDARKAAYQQGAETMRQAQLDTMRQQAELSRQKEMQQYQQFAPRNMSPEEIKDSSSLLASHGAIMMLYHQNADIPDSHPYRTAYVGQPLAQGLAKETDARIRLYEATRGGNIIPLGRTLLQDTGQVAGKEEAQDLVKQLMPGPGDNQQMSGRKTIDMVQIELNALQSKIQALPQNVVATPLINAYATAYRDYATLVNQYGSDAQKNYPAPSPKDLFGENAPQIAAPKIQPAVNSGFTQATNDSLAAQSKGQPPQAPTQSSFQEVDPTTRQPIQPSVAPQITPESPTWPTPGGAASQQAGQQAGGSQVWTPGNMPVPQTPSAQVITGKDVSTAAGALGQRAKDVTVEAGQEAGSGLSSILSFLNPDTWKEFKGQ